MHKTLKYLFILLILFTGSAALLNSYRNNPATIINNALKLAQEEEGELKYRIYAFKIIPVGEAVFSRAEKTKLNGRCIYRLNAGAKSLNAIKKFFSGRVDLASYIDCKSLNPLKFTQSMVIEGKFAQENEVLYDQEKQIMSIGGEGRQILPDTQDPLSLIYNLRNLDFDKEKKLEFNINTNQKNYILTGTVDKKEVLVNKNKKNIFIGKADVRRRDKDNPYKRSKIKVYFLEEKKNLPVLIKVFSGGAFLDIRLVEVK